MTAVQHVTPDHIHAAVDVTALPDRPGVAFEAAPWPEHLDAAVDEYERQHAEIATRELHGSDPVLHPIRAKVRPSVEPLLDAFDAQLAHVENQHRRPGPTADEHDELHFGRLADADYEDHPHHKEHEALQEKIRQRGTLTDRGYSEAKRSIAENRKGAIEAALKSVREDLDAAEAKVRAQQLDTRVKPKEADVEAAVDLMLQLDRTIPQHGAAILAERIADIGRAKNSGAAAALLPMLKSLHDAPDTDWHMSPELAELVRKTERLTKTWQQTVTAARLERIARTKYELARYAANQDEPDEHVREMDHGLFPDEPAPTRTVGDYEAARPRKLRIIRRAAPE